MAQDSHNHHILPPVLGVHTLMPHLIANAKTLFPADHPTLLTLSQGALPPYVVVMGDRRRVEVACKALTHAIFLPNIMSQHSLSTGRVNIAVGLYKGTPIALCEHQMGCAATEILVKELLTSPHTTTNFTVPAALVDGQTQNVTFSAPSKYVIRVGSAAGINTDVESQKSMNPQQIINCYDLVVTTHQLGISGADLQSLSGRLNYFNSNPALLQKIRQSVADLGYTFTRSLKDVQDSEHDDDEWPLLNLNEELSSHLAEHAQKMLLADAADSTHAFQACAAQMKCVAVGNVSKDSLYAESSEESFIQLRNRFNIGSSEMEFSTIARLAQQFTLSGDPVQVGMVLAILGTIPGESFGNNKALEDAAQHYALLSAFETLHQLSKKHQQ